MGVQQVSLSYFHADHYLDQTRIMMDGTNFLTDKCYMYVNLTPLASAAGAKEYSAELEFTIPGYDFDRLQFVVMNRNPLDGERSFCKASKTDDNKVYVPVLRQSTYDVHVYDGTLNSDNFVCKAEFCVTSKTMSGTKTANLLDSSGNQIIVNDSALKLTYYKPSSSAGVNQTCLSLPLNVVPYSSKTVKVVFFATDRNGEPVDIDHMLSDYVWEKCEHDKLENGGYVRYYPEIFWGTDSDVNYEAHFYKDEVKEENFICKAVDINFS